MGLHSKTRYVIHLQGKDRTEQMRDLILRAVDLFDRVQPVFCPEEPCMTRKFARHVSLTVTFVGSRMMKCLRLWHGKRCDNGGY